MSRKRKAQETILPVQSKRSENAITATVTIPTAPLSAFAGARARAIIINSDPLESHARNEIAQRSPPKVAEIPRSKKRRKPKSQPRYPSHPGEKPQDESIDSEDVFSQLPASSKYPMPEPGDFWDPNQDYPSDDVFHQEADETASLGELDATPTVRFSTWAPTKRNIISSTSKSDRFFMSNGETLSIVGQYRLYVHDGLITVAGIFLGQGAAAVEIYASSTTSLPVIKCISSEGVEIGISHINHSERTIDVLHKLSPLYSSIWANSSNSQSSFAKILDTEEQPKKGLLPLDVPGAWLLCIKALCSHKMKSAPTIQLCGPPNAGKSTFGMLLMNSLLTGPRSSNRPRSVAFIDLDQNKQECSPPGQISLILVKSPFLEPRFARSASRRDGNMIIRAHAIGLNGHKDDMAHYVGAACDLLQHYKSTVAAEAHDVPLIINCPAWYQGSGIDLTINLTKIMNTSQVLCFAQGPEKVLQGIKNAAGTTEVQTLPPQPFLSIRPVRTAVEIHEMQMLSYFHFDSGDGKGANWDATPLAHRRPYEVSYGERLREFAGVFVFGEVPVMYPNMLSTLLNGSIVSLIAIEDASAFDDREILCGEGDDIPYFAASPKGYTMPFDPQKSRVIGLALIRGIDAKAQTMQIISPVPGKHIAEVPWERLVIGFGAVECPGWAYLEEKYYLEWSKSKVGEIAGFDMAAPWVEAVGEEDGRRQVVGPGMQVWKTRRFQ